MNIFDLLKQAGGWEKNKWTWRNRFWYSYGGYIIFLSIVCFLIGIGIIIGKFIL